MANSELHKHDEEPSSKTDEYVSSLPSSDSIKHGSAFSKLNRELNDEDLNNRGTQRLILNELDKYEDCKKQLEKYKDDYYKVDKENAVLKAQLNSSTAFEVIVSIMITIGSILIGLTPSVLKDNKTYFLTWIILLVGVLSLIGAFLAKFINRRK